MKTMKKSYIRQGVFPVLAAMIWGAAFVFQEIAFERGMETFTFNTLRSVTAAITLSVGVLICRLARRAAGARTGFGIPESEEKASGGARGSVRMLVLGGLSCGTMLAIATGLQQYGIALGTTAGKAGFITTLYIVLVPLIGLFFGKKVTPLIWGSVVLAGAGLYFLCVGGESFRIAAGDLLMIACAVGFSLHILCVDYFSSRVSGVLLSCVQFAVMAVESGICMLLLEKPDLSVIVASIGPILYVGVMSSAVGYTLQILAQKDANPTVVSLLLSLESVFSVITSIIILHRHPEGREYVGCALMLTAVILAQLPRGFFRRLRPGREKKVYGTTEDRGAH